MDSDPMLRRAHGEFVAIHMATLTIPIVNSIGLVNLSIAKTITATPPDQSAC